MIVSTAFGSIETALKHEKGAYDYLENLSAGILSSAPERFPTTSGFRKLYLRKLKPLSLNHIIGTSQHAEVFKL